MTWIILGLAVVVALGVRLTLLAAEYPKGCGDHLVRHGRTYRCCLDPGHAGPHRSPGEHGMTWTRTRVPT